MEDPSSQTAEDFSLTSGDDPTQVKHNPLLAQWADDQPTVIKPGLALHAGAAEAPTAISQLPDVQSPPDGTATHAGSRVARTVGVMGFATVMFLAGLMLGAAVGMAGIYWLIRPEETTASPPKLRVMTPNGTTVRLNGELMSGDTEVAAGTPHQLQIELRGHESWSHTLSLAEGETRVLIVTATELQATPDE